MKTKLWITLGLALVLAVTGCRKCDPNDDRPEKTLNSSYMTSTADLADESDAEFQEVSLTGGTEESAFNISESGLPEMYRLEENSLNLRGIPNPADSNLRMRACLRKLNLTAGQLDTIKHISAGFAGCKREHMQRYMKTLGDILHKADAQRKENIALLRDGTITREQFENRMKELRRHIMGAVKEIKQKEAAAMRACTEKFLKAMKATLTEEQWRAFIACYGKRR